MLFGSVQYLEHVLGNQGIGVQGLQPWVDVGIEHAVARYVGVLQFHHRFAILPYLLYGGKEAGRVGLAAGERGLVAVDEVLHCLGLVPAQVVGDVVICLAHLLVLDETLETCLPALLVLEAGIVPCIVGNGEEGSSGHRTLLHGVGYEALAIVQRRGETVSGTHRGHVHEVAVHVHGIELSVGIVVTGIVPPPCHSTAKLVHHRLCVVVVGNRPYALSCGVYGDVGRHLAQCRHKALSLVNAACKAVAIYLWHEMQGSHGVLGGSTLVVPLGFYLSLKFGQSVGILLHVGIR